MVWGDFNEGKNKTIGESLLKYQKRLVGMIEGTKGRYHADPVFNRLGTLKIDDLYKQQLRIHAWQFANAILPRSQATMLCKVKDAHKYGTRASERGLFLYSTQDQRSIGYRLPKEWELTPQEVRDARSLQGMKSRSKKSFFAHYEEFRCGVLDCYVCCCNVGNAPGL